MKSSNVRKTLDTQRYSMPSWFSQSEKKTILDKLLSRFFFFDIIIQISVPRTCIIIINLVIAKLDRDIFFLSFSLALLPSVDKAVNSFATNCLHIVSASADVSRPISR